MGILSYLGAISPAHINLFTRTQKSELVGEDADEPAEHHVAQDHFQHDNKTRGPVRRHDVAKAEGRERDHAGVGAGEAEIAHEYSN